MTLSEVNVERGTIKVSGDTGAAALNAATLNVGLQSNAAESDLSKIEAVVEIAGSQTVGKVEQTADEDQYSKSSQINLYNGGKIEFTGAKGSAGTLQGATLNIAGGYINAANESGGKIEINDGTMTAGGINVGSGAQITLQFKSLQNGEKNTDLAPAKFEATGGSINVAGTLLISGGNAASVVSIGDDVTLSASGATSDTPVIQVSGGAADKAATLQMSLAKVDQFLNKDGSGVAALEGKGNGVIELTTPSVDLNNKVLQFSGSATKGYITLTASDTLKVQDATISEQVNLGSDNKFTGALEANNLTIKNAGSNSQTSLDKYVSGAASINVINDLEILDASNNRGDLTFDLATNLGTAKSTGTLKAGDVVMASGSTIKGDYTLDVDSLEISGAAISVGAGEYANVKVDTDTITVSGGSVTVSGGQTADGDDIIATLDLTPVKNYTLKTSSQAKTIFTASGNGVIKADGNALGNMFKAAKASSGAGFAMTEGGILEVQNGLTVDTAHVVSGDAINNASGNVITFVGDAQLNVDGTLNLSEDTSNTALNIGASGSITADTVKLAATDKTFTVNSGSLTVIDSLEAEKAGVEFAAATGKAALNLGTDEGAFDAAHTVKTSGGMTFSGSAASLNVKNGSWTLTGGLTVKDGASAVIGNGFDEDNADYATETSFSADKVLISGSTALSVTVNEDAKATFEQLAVTSTTGLKVDGGSLTITGKDNSAADNKDASTYGKFGLKYKGSTIAVDNGGNLTLTDSALDGIWTTETGKAHFDEKTQGDKTVQTMNKNSDYGSISLDGNSMLTLDFTEGTFTADEYVGLKHGLLTSGSLTGDVITSGKISLGKATVSGFSDLVKGPDDDGYYFVEDYDPIAQQSDLVDLYDEKMAQARIEGVDGDDLIAGHFGALQGEASASTVLINGNTSLNNADSNNGFFASYENNGVKTAAGAKVGAGLTFELNNGGTIGKVTLEQGVSDVKTTQLVVTNNAGETTTIASVEGKLDESSTNHGNTEFITKGGSTNVTGDVRSSYVEIGGQDKVGGNLYADDLTINSAHSLDVTGTTDTDELWIAGTLNQTGKLTSNYLNVYAPGAVNAKDVELTLGSGIGSEDNGDAASKIAGTMTAENLTVKVNGAADGKDFYDSDELQIAGGSLNVSKVFTAEGSGVTVRVGLDERADDEDTADIDESRASVGGEFYANTLVLNGNRVIVDPADGYQSVAGFGYFTDAPTSQSSAEYGNYIGALDGTIANGQNGVVGVGFANLADVKDAVEAFDGVGGNSLVVINGAMSFNGGALVVDPSRTGEAIEEALDEGTYNTVDKVAGTSTPNQVVLIGDDKGNGALAITEDALDKVNAIRTAKNGNANMTVLGDTSISILSAGAPIVVDTDSGENLAILPNGTKINGTEDLVVTNPSGLLYTEIEAGSTTQSSVLDLEFNRDKAEEYRGQASDPVFNLVMQYADKSVNPFRAADEDKVALHSGQFIAKETYEAMKVEERPDVVSETADENGNLELKVYNSFLSNIVRYGNLSDAETVARMAVYGGAAEVALAASSTSSEVIASRMGMGNPNGNLVMADNANGAGLWLAPVYKNHESDDFDAQGVDYGVDLDLYGVALGADYTFAQGFRAGAMFNIGSGDADGQGAGSAVSNDFDYWSLGIYGGYKYEDFSVTADLTYTAIDNDMDASTSQGKVNADMDADVVSAGLTAQYKFGLDVVDVTPHVGMRYTYIDIDDYSVDGIASSDVDNISVFSIPFGVSFSKDIATASGWNVKPALDLTVTVNTGDDEVDSNVRFNGVDMTTNLSTEFIDDVTYGATVGLQVQKDSFQFGLGVNYTGSENTDEYGVAANARFTF